LAHLQNRVLWLRRCLTRRVTYALTPSKSDDRARARASDSLGVKITKICRRRRPQLGHTFADEYRRFIMAYGSEIDERFFLKDWCNGVAPGATGVYIRYPAGTAVLATLREAAPAGLLMGPPSGWYFWFLNTRFCRSSIILFDFSRVARLIVPVAIYGTVSCGRV